MKINAIILRSGSHPKGPSGHGCCSDVLPPLSVSNQLLVSNPVSPCGNAMQWQTSSFQILFYIVHPSLIWASNRSFSCWLPIMNYGWSPLFVHSGDMAIPTIVEIDSFILLFRTVFSAISCPVLTRTSALLTLSVYLMRSCLWYHYKRGSD